MSRWTHNICRKCYNEKEPDRQPSTVVPEYRETLKCCFCGEENCDGIFYRYNPEQLRCQGEHE